MDIITGKRESKKLKIGILFGGKSPEHDVSLKSATAVFNNLDPEKYSILLIGIDKKGSWFISEDRNLLPINFFSSSLYPLNSNALIGGFGPNGPDIIFPVLHGPYGEDGTVQGLLEVLNIPYVGSGVLASAAGMDKITMKILFNQSGLPVLQFLPVHKYQYEKNSEEIFQKVNQNISYPCFVKPSNGGSSIGISKVKSQDKLGEAIKEAFRYDRRILIEKGITGREIEVAVLGNDQAQATTPGEIIPGREFYDYKAKYFDESSKTLIPAPALKDEQITNFKELALKSFQVLNCRGLARVDFFLEDKTNKIYLNEINTIPGFTSISMYPKLWEYEGINFKELVDRLIELGREEFLIKAAFVSQP